MVAQAYHKIRALYFLSIGVYISRYGFQGSLFSLLTVANRSPTSTPCCNRSSVSVMRRYIIVGEGDTRTVDFDKPTRCFPLQQYFTPLSLQFFRFFRHLKVLYLRRFNVPQITLTFRSQLLSLFFHRITRHCLRVCGHRSALSYLYLYLTFLLSISLSLAAQTTRAFSSRLLTPQRFFIYFYS